MTTQDILRPGVYVQEAPLPRGVSSPNPTQSYGAFIGTALQGPNTPVLLQSWSEFVVNFGDFSTYCTLPAAVYQFFINGGSACYVARVIHTSQGGGTAAGYAHANYADGQTTPDPSRIVVTAASPGIWGNTLGYRVTRVDDSAETFDFEVSKTYRGSTVVVERFTRLSTKPSDPRFIEKIVNSQTIGSSFVTVVEGLKSETVFDLLEMAKPAALAGGSDGGNAQQPGGGAPSELDYVATFANFDPIDALLLVNAPGYTTTDGLLQAVEARGDSVLLVDTDENVSPEDLADGSVTIPSGSSYAAVYYPWIYISDPAPDAPRGGIMKIPPSASAAGMILRTDSSRGVFKAPAGVGAGLSGAVANEFRFTNDELNSLAQENINVIRPLPGVGIAVMGARTRSLDTAQFLSVRRTINWVKKKAVNASAFALFEPNTLALWEQLRVANGVYLDELYRQGGLQGQTAQQAYYVKCDEDINTAQTISNGEVHIEIGISPVFPAEFIIIRVGQFESDASTIVTEEV